MLQKVVNKAGEFSGNKVADAVTKSNKDKMEKQKRVEKIIIPPEEKNEILNKFRKSIIKMEHNEISKLLNNSTISKYVEKNRLKQMIYQVVNILLTKI